MVIRSDSVSNASVFDQIAPVVIFVERFHSPLVRHRGGFVQIITLIQERHHGAIRIFDAFGEVPVVKLLGGDVALFILDDYFIVNGGNLPAGSYVISAEFETGRQERLISLVK